MMATAHNCIPANMHSCTLKKKLNGMHWADILIAQKKKDKKVDVFYIYRSIYMKHLYISASLYATAIYLHIHIRDI